MATPRFYSQHGEDCLLWSFFDKQPTGFFVDVGAFDGRYVSNTYAFELMGWKGICIEPHPVSYDILSSLRSTICLNVACVADETTTSVTLFMEKLGFLSGLLEDRQDDVKRRYEKRGLEFDGFETVSVPATTLNQILSEQLPRGAATEISFLSLDVEGTELDVLRGLDLKKYRPRVLLIETNSAPERETLSAYLAAYGYIFARRLEVNSLYAHDLRDVERLRSIQIDCVIEATPHPFGAELTPAQYTVDRRISTPAEIKPKPAPRLTRLIRRILGR
ncbi:MAG: FkbM family methyltransferase [Chloroflexi bacterium]|nr:FkbM family methyltransferase [Chloroflexota bacterium]